jgi:hypothetical protein
VGGKGQGNGTQQLNYPTGLFFDRRGDLYVADKDNHRVQRFAMQKKLNRNYFSSVPNEGRNNNNAL